MENALGSMKLECEVHHGAGLVETVGRGKVTVHMALSLNEDGAGNKLEHYDLLVHASATHACMHGAVPLTKKVYG